MREGEGGKGRKGREVEKAGVGEQPNNAIQ